MAQIGGGTFTGRAIYDTGVMTGVAEDVSDIIGMISPYETPLLAALGDANYPARSILHEWLEDALSPSVLVNSSAVASTFADTPIGIASGQAGFVQIGVLLRASEASGAEYLQVIGISGNTITVSRGFGGTNPGSMAPNDTLSVVTDVSLDGADVTVDTSMPRARKNNLVMPIKKDIIISDVVQAVTMLGGITSELDYQKQKKAREALRDLNKAVILSRLSGNTFGSASSYRTMAGLLQLIKTNVSSWGTLTSENLTQSIKLAWNQGGVDCNLIVCGDQVKHTIDGFNNTYKQTIQGSGQEHVFSESVSFFECTYGALPLLLDRWMPPTRFLILATGRVKVMPLSGRSFQYEPVARTGTANKGMLVGDYTLEVKNEEGLVQGKVG